jgi:transcriptional regulator
MSSTVHKNLSAKIITGPKNDNSSVVKENNDNAVKKKANNNGNDKNNINNNNDDITIKANLPNKITILDIERENRLSKVISLYSKGLNQEEIAQKLNVDQSTVSRDLQFIKQEARKQIEKYLREDILFEYLRYMAGSNEITRKLWEIAQDKDTTIKEKSNALSLLMQSYNSRLQTLTAGPESYMNIKKSLSEIDLQRMVNSNPVLKAQVQQKKLFAKGLFNLKA